MRGEFSVFRQRLLDWFNREKRVLPWRTDPSLYGTVVSEFMLQQTQVETVLPYYKDWLLRFPDFESLAQAEESQVVKQWEGLGYYTRARNLHKLAKSICEAGIPTSFETWLELPGIGPYTAAAISSIAQGIPEPVIDGNVIRVLCRISNDPLPIKSSTDGRKRLLPLARELIDPKFPGDFNEAIMELGATVCRKARPSCLLCPVREHCLAAAAGNESNIPVITRRTTRRISKSRLWLVRKGCLLLHIYPDDSPRLAGLAELPEIETPTDKQPILKRARGISTETITESIFDLGLEHQETIRCIHMDATRWVPFAALESVPLSGPHKRWIGELLRMIPGADIRSKTDKHYL